jgi:23S rRNA pseudouridine2457 synthase
MHRHFMLHKPYGYLSQFVGEAVKKKRLGSLFDFPDGTMAIGRLDEDSEGLLLLTTDGKLSEHIRSRHVEKEYLVQLDGQIDAEALEKLQLGVEISIEKERHQSLPCQVSAIEKPIHLGERTKKIRDERHGPTSWISLIITEGKFRQIRKMTAAVGFPTLRLIRVRIGSFQLGTLPVGAVLEISVD